ncbi:OLC1v1003130C1 [Oldenlandia corymbosa var. corymbosa]|uniref:OLC1v1003130C1 n=1 Tax=Oldenlandia corymbosa var. corymbosa TaxID=529605 RepID=A0AAV1DBQ2_OLDCO|nr:OLC1v1003130C1 [Oldenlandia corymbosa var. corymbosa]
MENRREIDLLIEEQLHVHGSESPGTQIVSVLLTSKNYLIWRCAMISALESKMKVGFVDGNFLMAADDSPIILKWRKANSMVCSWKSFMTPDLMNQFMFIHDATKLWRSLEQRFGKTNLPHLFELTREIALLRQRNWTVSDYFEKIEQIWN